MVTHVRIGGGPRDGHGGAERYAIGTTVSVARTIRPARIAGGKGLDGPLGRRRRALVALALDRAARFDAGAAMQGAHRERRGLALLPCKMARRHDVEREVENMERLPIPGPAPGAVRARLRPELVHRRIVLRIEPGERIRVALLIGRSQERADQPVAVE